MTAIVRAPLQGEIIAPGRGLTLVVVPRILDIEALPPLEVAAGLSLAELAEQAAAMSGGRPRFVASINGLEIDDGFYPWRLVRPKPGSLVTFRAVPEFGGDNSLINTLLSAAVLVAGAVLTAVNPLLGAAVTVGGQMLVNALFPISPPVLANVDNGSISSPTYSLGGSGNSPDLWGVVPSHLGRNRYTPKAGAKTYTEFVGADQYLRMLVVWGYGPLEISDIKIGETPLASFADVEIETNLGYADDPPITLYPHQVDEEALSVDLTAAGGAQMRTTGLNVDEISVDFVAPSGIVRIDGNGAAQAYTVQLKVEYRLTGSGDPWALLGTSTLTSRSRDPIRTGLRLVVNSGQYDVQVTKTSADSASDQVTETVVWSALRGMRSAPPVAFSKPLAMTALRIRATSQLNGQIDDLNAIVASRVNAFDGAGWQPDTVSNNPADLFRHVCQGPANAKPLSDDGVDIESLEGWWPYCVAHGFTFNLVRDFTGSVDDALVAIAAAGRATVKRRDGKRGVVWDDPEAPVVQLFTPRNSWGFGWDRQYQKSPPHAFRIRFINSEAGYQQDEIIVYDDGYNADGSDGLVKATLFEQIEAVGIDTPAGAWAFGRYHIAQARLRPETYPLNADLNSFAVSRGARVRVMSDVALWGIAAGRALSAAAADDANDHVVLDEPVIMEAGKAYTIRFWLSDSSSGTRDVVTVEGEQTTLTLAGHGLLPECDDQWSFGEEGKDSVVLRVLKVTPGPNLSARLLLVDDAPELANADQGEIPLFDSQITIPLDPFTAAPINLSVAEAYEGVGGATATGALFAWDTLAGEQAASFEVEHRDDDGSGVYVADGSVTAPTKAMFLPGLLRGTWSFRVRCVFANGSVSKWSELARIDITSGSELTLPSVANVVTSYDDATATITWDPVKFSNLDVFYEVRKGDDWATALLYGPNLAQPRFKIAGNGKFLVAPKAQPVPGITIYGPPASITIAGAILTRNVYAELHEHADGWDGVLTNCAIEGEVVTTNAANVIAYYELRSGKFFDINFLRRMRIDAAVKAVGVPVNQNVLDDPDFLNNPDVLAAGSSAFIEAWVEIAVAGDLENDVFAAGDVFASPDVFAGAAVFGDYQKFAPGEYEGRFFKLQVAFRSNSDAVKAALTEFDIIGDVPDRIDHYTNLAVDAGGSAVTFVPNGGSDPKPFKAGPGADPLPHCQVTWNNTAGDELLLTGLSTAGVTVQILNGGVGQSRVVNLEVQGW